ncbi:hypothetical protein SCHPADRAFT_909207 [Schizopora paradoxa]|uniref:BTB domain-containing protein n=1 Tax=Schizopora paradoxa TaxID=27342 RepID=A0A0H2R8N7_9AGAM|nr:hypothetical protein SCHPADRAFT_909207 [Schizopora paradoxa]
MDVEDLSKLKQHEKLWFEDGNIVLATDVHLYSVHRGVLAKHSTVFKDMLDLPNVGNTLRPEVGSIANGDSWEGKPLVRMVGDSDEDVYHILTALYELRFYSEHQPTTLPIILSLLRMSSKYNFSEIHNAITNQIESVYPNDLDSMKERDYRDLFEDYDNIADDYEFQLLAAVLQSDLRTVLPTLYFECATSQLDTILKSTESLHFEKQHVDKLLRGHERMVEYSYEYGIKQFVPQRTCTTQCSKSRGQLLANYIVDCPYKDPLQELLQESDANDDADLREAICKNCSKVISENLEAFRLEIWNSIPGLFGLGTWEDAKRD